MGDTDTSNPFTIHWGQSSTTPPQFFKHPCEVKVSKVVWQGGTGSVVHIYLILPAGPTRQRPTRQRPAYTRVMSVEFQFITDWQAAEPTLRAVIGLIPIRLGVTVTAISWWGYKRTEVLNG